MPWLQLKITSDRDQATPIQDVLETLGALSVTFEDNADQPIFEPALGEMPLWQNTLVTGLFDAAVDTHGILASLSGIISAKQARWQILEDKDWEREWMSNYHPIQCGEDFWICPSWCPPPDKNATNLILDPGLAFGTGTHPTTFLCLSWLAKQSFSDKLVVDYGCGSGILGIAALLRGASKAIGTDIDPQALLATHANLARNNLNTDNFPVYFPEKCPDIQADITFANILAGPLVELAPTLSKLTKAKGFLCLSGILSSQRTAIEEAYQPYFDIVNVLEKEEWIAVIAVRRTLQPQRLR